MENYLVTLNESVKKDYFLSRELEELLHDTSDEKNIFSIKTEVKCFRMRCDDGTLKPLVEIIYENGEIYQEPNIAELTVEEVSYLIERTETSENQYHLARYFHVLYIKTKNKIYGEQAASSYKRLISQLIKPLINKDINVIEFVNLIKCYHDISLKIKYELDECKNKIKFCLDGLDIGLFYKSQLITLIARSKLFLVNDLAEIYEREINNYVPSADTYQNEKFLESILLITNKGRLDKLKIFVLLAENKILEIESDNDKQDIILANNYQNAANYFRLAKEIVKCNECLRKYEYHKKKIILSSISTDFSTTKLNGIFSEFSKIIDEILEDSNVSPFIFLAWDENILPKDKHIGKTKKKSSIIDFVSTSYIDKNLNVLFPTSWDKGQKEFRLDYDMYWSFIIKFLIRLIKQKMKAKERIMGEEILQYFKSSWLSIPLKKYLVNDEFFVYNWLDTLMPAFEILFTDKILEDENVLKPIEQMAFDQLTIKFEGILRDLYSIIGISTTKVGDKGTTAKNLDDLLASNEESKGIDEQDILLWKYVFTHHGNNLRNDIAHSFFREKDYIGTKVSLLLMSYLRISRYNQLIINQSEI